MTFSELTVASPPLPPSPSLSLTQPQFMPCFLLSVSFPQSCVCVCVCVCGRDRKKQKLKEKDKEKYF